MSVKEFFFKIEILYRFIPISFLMRLSGKTIILPFYHFVTDEEESLVNHLYKPKTTQQFLEDIIFFKKYFVSLSVNHLRGGKVNESYGFILSFDDGLSNFYEVVAPILLREDVTSINFLNSSFVDNKDLFYRYKVNLIVSYLQKNNITINTQLKIKKLLALVVFDFGIISQKLKMLSIKNIDLIDETAKILGISFSKYLQNEKPYLSSEQISDLKGKGFLFGGHSKNHPRYSLISLEEQISETIGSMEMLKKKLRLKENYFSFPFSDDGVSLAFFKKIASRNLITFGTSGLKDENLENHYQRIPMEYNKVYSAETIIKGELLYYVLKKFFGKHKTKRV